MARRCICSRLLSRVAGDMGFHVLPLVVQAVWLRLFASAEAAGEGGRLRFPIPVSEAVSRLLQIAEPEARSALESLVGVGFLDLDADGRTVWMPGSRDAEARVAAARSNGEKGGRPRKGETPEQARLRRAQPSMPLPIPGGRDAAAETQESKTDPHEESSRAGGATATSESAKPAAPSGRDVQALGDELAEIAKLDGVRLPFTYGPVRDWLSQGAAPDLLRQVVRRVAERPGYAAAAVKGLGYFAPAVREALERGERVVVERAAADETPSDPAFAAYAAWAAGGMVGPMPVLPARGAA